LDRAFNTTLTEILKDHQKTKNGEKIEKTNNNFIDLETNEIYEKELSNFIQNLDLEKDYNFNIDIEIVNDNRVKTNKTHLQTQTQTQT